MFLNNFGRNTLYRNKGDATFTDVTSQAGLGAKQDVGAGASFLDIDADGDLDLFVANYVDFTFESHHISYMNGLPAYVGPLNYPATINTLFRNNGDGTFSDITKESGLADLKGAGMGVIACDFDNDHDTDIIVGNDLRPDFVIQNDGSGKFKEIGGLLGLAYDGFGNVQGSMGVECGDWNNDGWMDIYITPYQRQWGTLFENRKGAYFEDVARKTGAANGTYAEVKWGIGMVDFNNDGHRDIFIACGHLIDNAEAIDASTHYRAQNILLQNTGKGRFANVTNEAGDGLAIKLSSRGAAFDDLDNDGDIDVVVLNARSKPSILQNESTSTNHWIQIQLQGGNSNSDGIGARVTVKSGDLIQIDEVHCGRSYQSDFGKRLHFGLGPRKMVDEIRVDWIGGASDILKHVQINRLWKIREGKGLQAKP